jgi:hypothetical protein
MARFTFIGDTHGKVGEYLNIIVKADYSLALGDMGIGFRGIAYPAQHAKNHKFICGNHDNFSEAKNCPAYLGKFGSWNGIFFVSGAASHDKHLRTIGVDWWPEEELSYDELSRAISAYSDLKPIVVATHDCPQSIAQKWFGIKEKSKTRIALQVMFEIWKPNFWFFGHHHRSLGIKSKGCRFRCLAPLETYSFDWFNHNKFLDNIFPFVTMKKKQS